MTQDWRASFPRRLCPKEPSWFLEEYFGRVNARTRPGYLLRRFLSEADLGSGGKSRPERMPFSGGAWTQLSRSETNGSILLAGFFCTPRHAYIHTETPISTYVYAPALRIEQRLKSENLKKQRSITDATRRGGGGQGRRIEAVSPDLYWDTIGSTTRPPTWELWSHYHKYVKLLGRCQPDAPADTAEEGAVFEPLLQDLFGTASYSAL